VFFAGDKSCARCPMSDKGKMPTRGCHGTQVWVGDVATDRCPVMFQHEYSHLFQMHFWAAKGFLPFRGGWAEQPMGVITALTIMFNEETKQNVAADKRAMREQQNQQ